MWIILLDHSTSMGGTFKNKPPSGRFVKETEAESRLEAAKEILLDLLGRWSPDDEVLLLPFTTTVTRIGPLKAGDRAEVEKELATIGPAGGTDIADALNSAVAEAEKRGERTTAFLISDGESDLVAAEAAAAKCRGAGVTVFVYAIDPDEQSETLSMRVSSITGGTWDRVTSKKSLAAAATKAADLVGQQAKAADEMVKRFDHEHKELCEQRQNSEEVQFTAAYARRVKPKRIYPLHVAVHREEELDAVEQKLKGMLERQGLSAQPVTTEAMMRLPLGTILEIEPRLPGMHVSPRRAEVAWNSTTTILDFEMQTSRDDIVLVEGAIEITTPEGLLVGRVPVTFRVANAADSADLPNLTSTRLIDRVFASYAHEDEAIVLACRKIYQGLGIQLFVDHEDILSGAFWSDALAKAIGGSDLFQLFWSQASADSPEVKKEWMLALGLADQKPKNFVRPVHWHRRDPVPDPPQELGDIHFRYLDLNLLEVGTEVSNVRAPRSVVQRVEISSQLTLLPLVGDCDAMMGSIRDEMGRVVPFLEQVTGLRYYPAPMLLVEHYVARSVREVLTVDKPDEEAGSTADQGENAWVLTLFADLLLAFHCRALEAKEYLDDAALAAFYDLGTRTEHGDFLHLRVHAEGGFRQLIEGCLKGQDPLGKVDDGSKAIEKASQDPRWGRFDLGHYIAHLAAVCRANDRGTLDRIAGQWLTSDGPRERCNIGENEIPAILNNMQTSEAIELRNRYAGDLNCLFDEETTTLCRESDLMSYFIRSIELYQVYADRALQKRGDFSIRIGMALPLDVLLYAQNELGLVLRIEDELKNWSEKETAKYYFSLDCSEYSRAIITRAAPLTMCRRSSDAFSEVDPADPGFSPDVWCLRITRFGCAISDCRGCIGCELA